MTEDEKYMTLAIEEARKAERQGEIPVGCVIVASRDVRRKDVRCTKDGRREEEGQICEEQGMIVGRGHNLTQALQDVTAHAEMQAITAAAQTLGGKYLTDCTLYVTLEPCVMCAGAIGWAQVKRLVYGASDPKMGYTVYAPKALHPKTEVTGGVMEEECGQMMSNFFRN